MCACRTPPRHATPAVLLQAPNMLTPHTFPTGHPAPTEPSTPPPPIRSTTSAMNTWSNAAASRYMTRRHGGGWWVVWRPHRLPHAPPPNQTTPGASSWPHVQQPCCPNDQQPHNEATTFHHIGQRPHGATTKCAPPRAPRLHPHHAIAFGCVTTTGQGKGPMPQAKGEEKAARARATDTRTQHGRGLTCNPFIALA